MLSSLRQLSIGLRRLTERFQRLSSGPLRSGVAQRFSILIGGSFARPPSEDACWLWSATKRLMAPRVDRTIPTIEMRERCERGSVAGQHSWGSFQPSPGRNIGDREILPDDELTTFQMGVEHFVVALDFPAVAVDRVGKLFRSRMLEMNGLSRER